MKKFMRFKTLWTIICMSLMIIFLHGNYGTIIYASELDTVESTFESENLNSTQVSPYTIEDGVYFIRNIYSGTLR